MSDARALAGASLVQTVGQQENMTRNVLAIVDDLFFASKIRGTAEEVGVTVRFARNPEAMLSAARRDQPDLIIFDLNSERVNPAEMARQLKADEQLCSIPLLGFFSHVQTELQRQAEEAGIEQVIPRSIFTKYLNEILLGAK
jgi:PleD family two-component response regulator